MKTEFPRASRANCDVRELDGETIIYNKKTHQAVCLNASAAKVWELADGSRAPADIAAQIDGMTQELVEHTLTKLSKAGLLETEFVSDLPANMNRRNLVKKVASVAGAAALIPVVTSITAPMPAQAASCVMAGQPCPGGVGNVPDAGCCSGMCGGFTLCA
ncbi:MAG: PqqD family protein [Pseudomonadota bacterium]